MSRTIRIQRITGTFLKTLGTFLEDPHTRMSGSDIIERTGIASGTVYPLLARMVKAGWLQTEWEKVDPVEGRPPKRLYKLTKNGCREGCALFEEHAPPQYPTNLSPVR